MRGCMAASSERWVYFPIVPLPSRGDKASADQTFCDLAGLNRFVRMTMSSFVQHRQGPHMATVSDTTAADRYERDLTAAPKPILPPTTVSSVPIEALYTPETLNDFDPDEDLGFPGQYPFTRGVHATMYRSRLWTMRQFAGFGTPRQTNERFKFLLQKGQTGLSTAFDLPTLMGLDSDDPRGQGEVGRLGVAVSTLDDLKDLYDGIDVGKVSVSMTINAPAIVVMAFYLANAADRGIDWKKLGGTVQNDILKEFHAQNEFVFPPEPSVRLVCDAFELCTPNVPQWKLHVV